MSRRHLGTQIWVESWGVVCVRSEWSRGLVQQTSTPWRWYSRSAETCRRLCIYRAHISVDV